MQLVDSCLNKERFSPQVKEKCKISQQSCLTNIRWTLFIFRYICELLKIDGNNEVKKITRRQFDDERRTHSLQLDTAAQQSIVVYHRGGMEIDFPESHRGLEFQSKLGQSLTGGLLFSLGQGIVYFFGILAAAGIARVLGIAGGLGLGGGLGRDRNRSGVYFFASCSRRRRCHRLVAHAILCHFVLSRSGLFSLGSLSRLLAAVAVFSTTL